MVWVLMLMFSPIESASHQASKSSHRQAHGGKGPQSYYFIFIINLIIIIIMLEGGTVSTESNKCVST